MSDEGDGRTGKAALVSRLAHVVERTGLAMSGAISGTFVAAYLSKGQFATFDSTSLIASMVLVGMVGFYLGIDIPQRRDPHIGCGATIPQWDPVELLSATGTFLAAAASLAAVYAIVFDEAPQRLWEFLIGSWWLLGVTMQIGAGTLGRRRVRRRRVEVDKSTSIVPDQRTLASVGGRS